MVGALWKLQIHRHFSGSVWSKQVKGVKMLRSNCFQSFDFIIFTLTILGDLCDSLDIVC